MSPIRAADPSTHKWRLLRKRAIRELPLACVECGTLLDLNAPRSSAAAAELDHIIPRRAGGTDTFDNVQWLCAPHNRRKSDRELPASTTCRFHDPITSTCPHSRAW